MTESLPNPPNYEYFKLLIPEDIQVGDLYFVIGGFAEEYIIPTKVTRIYPDGFLYASLDGILRGGQEFNSPIRGVLLRGNGRAGIEFLVGQHFLDALKLTEPRDA